MRPLPCRTKPTAHALILAAALAAPVAAGDWIVTRYDDPAPDGCLVGDCSLREAVIAANADTDADRILLSAGHYLLEIPGTGESAAATGDLDLRTSIEIVGPGATMTTIDGAGLDRVFEIADGNLADAITPEILLRGLTITGGDDLTASAVRVKSTSTTIEECELTGNAGGWAIRVDSGEATVRGTTVTGNAVGIMVFTDARIELENSTLAANAGRELFASGEALCTHCTISDPTDGGDAEIHVFGAAGSVTLVNSIVAGNCSLESDGSVVSGGGNLESPGDGCGLDQGDDQPSVVDPLLGALGDNGGPTRTIRPEAGSPALDLAAAAGCLATDQRGGDRDPGGLACDRGAVEVTADDPPTPIFHDGAEQGHADAWSDQQPAP